MTELRPNVVFHDRNFVFHLGICNPICVKLLKVISDVITSNWKKRASLSQTVFLRSTNAAHTHTHTHTHTHISPKNRYRSFLDDIYVFGLSISSDTSNKLPLCIFERFMLYISLFPICCHLSFLLYKFCYVLRFWCWYSFLALITKVNN